MSNKVSHGKNVRNADTLKSFPDQELLKIFNAKANTVKSRAVARLGYTHCLGINYYVNFLGHSMDNGFIF